MYDVEMGLLETQTVKVVDFPRSRFIELVRVTIDSIAPTPEAKAWLRKELLPVAESMPHFPFSEWLHIERGCGCLVGEYLVAAAEVDRASVVEKVNDDPFTFGPLRVHNMLDDRVTDEQAQWLIWVGNRIDWRLREAISAEGSVEAVVFTDE